MKRFLAMALAITFVCTLAPTPAQSSVGVFATWWNGTDTDNGFGGGAKFKVPLIPILSLEGRASYVGWENDLYTIPLEAVGSLNLGLFYGGVSLGYYIWGLKDAKASNRVGGSIFAGVGLGLGGVGVFGELRYNVAKTEIDELHEVKADGFSNNLGVNF